MFKCPTSELPICPSGKPTCSPDVRNVLCGYFTYKLSTNGVFAFAMASDFDPSPIPQPSNIINATFFIMQRMTNFYEKYELQIFCTDNE